MTEWSNAIEAEIDQELALAESSRPGDPIVETDVAWRTNPLEVEGYESRLRSLRGAIDSLTATPPEQ